MDLVGRVGETSLRRDSLEGGQHSRALAIKVSECCSFPSGLFPARPLSGPGGCKSGFMANLFCRVAPSSPPQAWSWHPHPSWPWHSIVPVVASSLPPQPPSLLNPPPSTAFASRCGHTHARLLTGCATHSRLGPHTARLELGTI